MTKSATIKTQKKVVLQNNVFFRVTTVPEKRIFWQFANFLKILNEDVRIYKSIQGIHKLEGISTNTLYKAFSRELKEAHIFKNKEGKKIHIQKIGFEDVVMK